MQSQIVTVAALLFCCGLIYVVIWNRMPSSHVVHLPTRKPELFWGALITPPVTPLLNLSSGKTTAGASVNRATLRTSELKHRINITPIPILYKKNFTKLPKWDFDDVYMQSSGARRPVCSKSLQNSKDKAFQEAAMWKIQLWLHNGHLNVSEWNRLTHFNNPYGFMEYNYTDIKRSVDLIPKPKYYQLLPVPSGSTDGCIRCAVVGTGGILNGSKMGTEIDSHDYVFRMNGAVTKGFEEDVGNKTSVYVHTSFSLTQSIIGLGESFKRIPHDEGIIYVMIPEGLRDFEWLEGLLGKKRMTYGSYKGYRPFTFYSDRFREDKFYVLHPDFLRYIRNRFLPSKTLETSHWAIYRPTNGAFTLFLALHTCDIVNAYGFITADHSKYPNYYIHRNTKTRVIFYINHDYNVEIKTWKKLHDAGIINLYQRQEKPNPTVT
ncbi:alpha-N-acetylgalactosaminide alpha-2,6-sialyltransferase 1-like [Ictalurus punctatus]|uniref:alpha-N-acetylgalactosaminide alpha-2,6-sialyltransferase n=1 Tax=Ictalurus punctatus TaxID=7998 RepID=A0A9F7RS29_ICTPU|nr:alpha-N-acetylgalactosaminide alpha-2,6-sialyltransferase 1 [Ictalurus punctatus]XP_053541268.1 alpha-N-acetylgalactosaminide alpha-2,6-sialyltransferase 1-like [Ictalurus punctatus]